MVNQSFSQTPSSTDFPEGSTKRKAGQAASHAASHAPLIRRGEEKTLDRPIGCYLRRQAPSAEKGGVETKLKRATTSAALEIHPTVAVGADAVAL